VEGHDAKSWYTDPVVTIVGGKALADGSTIPTLDAFEFENGTIHLATTPEVDAIINHMQTFTPGRDYRSGVRAVEVELFENHPAALIGNQALDFRKQDGVTEIEESVQVPFCWHSRLR
jgi:hypothetical protein